jgi:uncharacterized membrane protein YbhN (UPF0104 family)
VIRRLLPIAGTALLVFYLSRLDLRALGAQIGAFPPHYAAAVLALDAATGLLKAARWRAFLGRLGTRTPAGRAYLAVHAGFFMGLVTPGTAGEFSRAASLDEGRERGVAVLALEKLTDLVSLGLLAAATLAWHVAPGAPRVAALLLFAAAIAAWYVTYPRTRALAARPLRAAARRVLPAAGGDRAGLAAAEFGRLTENARAPAASLVYSLGLWGLSLAQVVLIYRGLGLDPPLRFAALTYFLPYLVGIVSLVPLGLGTFELSLRQIGLRSAGGLPGDVVGMMPVFFRAFVTLPLVLFGYACQVALAVVRSRPKE